MKSAVTSRASEREVASVVDLILGQMRAHGLDASASLVLIGSAARHARRPGSDIDIMLIAGAKPSLADLPYDVHLQVLSRDEFADRLRQRDDLALWAVRHGEPVSDPDGWFDEMRRTPDAQAWPDPAPNLRLARQRLRTARELLDIGDEEAAQEELLFAVSHLARAVLIKHHVFPLSRGELAGQLAEVGEDEIAVMLQTVVRDTSLSESRSGDLIEQAGRRLKRRLRDKV